MPTDAGFAQDAVALVAAYGLVAPGVVNPAEFESAVRCLPLVAIDEEAARQMDMFTSDVLARLPDDERAGPGFYAFGAVALLLYAKTALLDPAGDGGEHGLWEVAQRWLATGTETDAAGVAARIKAHAEQLLDL